MRGNADDAESKTDAHIAQQRRHTIPHPCKNVSFISRETAVFALLC